MEKDVRNANSMKNVMFVMMGISWIRMYVVNVWIIAYHALLQLHACNVKS